MNNTMNNIMTNNNINFEMCQYAPLLEIGAAKSMGLEVDYMQIISITSASIIGALTMLYGYFCRCLKNRGFRLHFVGIGRPANFSKSQYKLLDNIDAESTMITINSSLKEMDSIQSLKELIRKTYSIPSTKDILLIYSHHIITNNELKLSDVGITNNSLITLAICDSDKIILPPKEPEPQIEAEPEPQPEPEPYYESESESESEDTGNAINAMFGMYADYESEPEPVRDVNELFGMFQDDHYDQDEEEEELEEPKEPTPPPPTWPRPGFDIITQENDVLVHKMPECGHEMNADSLYQYALSTFSDSNKIHLKCPHNTDADSLCNAKWGYSSITDILRYNHEDKEDKTRWTDYAKLELLSSRNMVENECNVQKCPRCNTLYFMNYDENIKPLEDIKTIEDIESAFKFECIFCPSGSAEIVERVNIPKPAKPESTEHFEDDIEEDIDGDAVNALFGMVDDDDMDSEDEEDDNLEALKAVNHMFDDDEPDFEEIIKEKVLNGFCFCCGDEWIDDHVCSSSFKSDLVEILSVADTKQIGSVDGVPSIRCCPSCSQLIFHVDACKHMQCKGCSTDFCFVCMKPKKNGNWQCGSHSDKCPVADRQNMETLPKTIVITKKSFKLFD